MSRHKIVKNLDLDEELDEFDGGGGGDDYYAYGSNGYDGGGGGGGIEELSAEDQEQMRAGTLAVRDALGPDVPSVSDADIHEALWHYYYDVAKSVTYLLDTRMKKEHDSSGGGKKKKKRETGSEKGGLDFPFCEDGEDERIRRRDSGDPQKGACIPRETCTNSFIPADFWNDMTWLNIPPERQTIFLHPPYLRGGLLGGSPDAPPKMSKLQALAAARKKKAQEEKSKVTAEAVNKPMADLAITSPAQKEAASSITEDNRRDYRMRKRKSSSPHKRVPQPVESSQDKPSDTVEELIPPQSVEVARPSAFASTMFGRNNSTPSANALFTLPYLAISSANSTDAFAGPSPDDVVLAAQSKAAAAKTTKGPAKTAGEKKADQMMNSVEALRIDDTPRATSKNLDVLAEYGKTKAKNAANFVVIGHVDAGKSTLMGRLLYDLKVVDQRTIEKYKKEAERMGKSSFALAWVLDQGTEERSRGVTIDIASNKFETEKTAFTILDAPGHRDFIPNMIAGASQADFAVLVIDASTNAFEAGLRGQTKEHALLVRSMGVQRLIIAVNKLDTVSWSQDRFLEISQQVSAFLTAAGFQSKNISFIPVSGLHGENIVTRSTQSEAAWYTGPTLVEELDNSEPVARALEKPLRLTIGDIFRGGVQNPLSISGRIEAGSLQSGDALIAMPSSQKCFIKALEIDNEAVDWAVAGQNVTVHLSGIDPAHLKIGDVLCRPGSEIKTVKEIKVKVLAFEFLTPMAVDVHRGRLHAAGKIREITALLDKSTGAVIKKKPRVVKPGVIARVVVELDIVCPLEGGQRVVLRSGGETVGAGLLE